jgi:hypothetical protein
MCVGWWAGGYLLCHVLMVKIGNPCPCPKCWIGSFVALAFGIGEYYVIGLNKLMLSPPYFFSVVFAAIVGGAVCLAICPIRLGRQG